MERTKFRREAVADLPEIIKLLTDDDLGRRREELGPAAQSEVQTSFRRN